MTRRKFPRLAALCILWLLVSPGWAAQASLIRDIAEGNAPINGLSIERGLGTSGDVLYVARRPDVGVELWHSDGTPNETGLVRDINPWWGDSDPHGFVQGPDGTWFFFARDCCNWFQLWAFSDGQARRVTDATTLGFPMGMTDPVFLGDRFYFFASQISGGGWTLWESDGTSLGTRSVVNFADASGIYGVVRIGDTVVFAVDPWGSPSEMWCSDGTSAGTRKIADQALPRYASGAAVVGGILYFRSWSAAAGYELWRTDGTERGTWMVADIVSGSEGAWLG